MFFQFISVLLVLDVRRSSAREREAQVQVAGQQTGTGQDTFPAGESHSGRQKGTFKAEKM